LIALLTLRGLRLKGPLATPKPLVPVAVILLVLAIIFGGHALRH
jgi:hypothetical protein